MISRSCSGQGQGAKLLFFIGFAQFASYSTYRKIKNESTLILRTFAPEKGESP
jgi:hypothetical protein